MVLEVDLEVELTISCLARAVNEVLGSVEFH